jgi:hypothetical protein
MTSSHRASRAVIHRCGTIATMPDWSTITLSGACSALLTALVFGFWKPWLGAYGGEKGKNLARKEDLNEILAEVRAVTITQKEIEAKLTGEQWDRQTRWNEKRNTYAALLSASSGLTDALGSLPVFIRTYDGAVEPVEKQKRLNVLVAQMTKVNTAKLAYNAAHMLAMIFASDECVALLREYRSPWCNAAFLLA